MTTPIIRPTKAIGVITPSANLVVERINAAVFQSFPEVSAHYSRTPVRGSKDPFPTSYDMEGMLGAAKLLGDAKLDGIVWNGSKGASIGLKHDHDLVAAITAETGQAATTSILAIDDELRRLGITRVAVVSPYRTPYQDQLVATITAEGYTVVAEAHSGVADNLAYMNVPLSDIADMIRTVAAVKPDAILTLCTNFPAAYVVAELEAELSVPIFDSVLAGVWAALRQAGIDASAGRAWGHLFAGIPH